MLIDQWYEDGVTIWQPAQTMNDLSGIQKKYGNKFVLNGCWDTSGVVSYDDTTEETIRQLTRDTIDQWCLFTNLILYQKSVHKSVHTFPFFSKNQ